MKRTETSDSAPQARRHSPGAEEPGTAQLKVLDSQGVADTCPIQSFPVRDRICSNNDWGLDSFDK